MVPFSDTFTCTVGTGATIELFNVTADTGFAGINGIDYPNMPIHSITVDNLDSVPTAVIVP